MWIVTTYGLFSIVQNEFCGEGQVAVRSRTRRGLEKLFERHGIDAEIIELPDADYRWRAHIDKDDVGRWLASEAAGIDYANFKAAFSRQNKEPFWHDIMHHIWSAMYRAQELILPSERSKAPRRRP